MRRVVDVPDNVLQKLNGGTLETRNLMQAFALDMRVLANKIGLRSARVPDGGIIRKMQVMGEQLPSWKAYSQHQSDTVRGWAAYRLAADKKLSFSEKLSAMRTFADDHHFGVREWAWLALRGDIINNLEEAIELLESWVHHESSFIRRFATESTRPIGVWSAHIASLKLKPHLGLVLLEPLKSDPSSYVQKSVANWLNDAAKTNPTFVKKVCKRWQQTSSTVHTERIIHRALRSLITMTSKRHHQANG